MDERSPHLFRAQALEHHLGGEEGRGLIRVSPPWSWALLLVFLSAFGTALLAAFLGRVEVNGRARAILRPRTGIRVVIAKVDGTVGQVEARSGQQVRAGTVLARLEAPPVQAQLLEARRQVEAVHLHFRATAARQDQGYAEQVRRLTGRMAGLGEQRRSQRQSVAALELNLKRCLILEGEGILSPARADEAREALAQAQRQLSQSDQALELASQERAALENSRQDNLWQRRQTIQNAEVRAEALGFLLGQTRLEAPEDGQVEAMLVKPGEGVRAGQALCKLIPRGAPLEVVAFLPEKDRAFVRPGDEVRLELDQLPYAEYGTLRGRVERISEDLASGFEIQEALGDTTFPGLPVFRVEVRLTDTQAVLRAGVPLRSGMLMNARFTLRRQRPITLVLDPLRKWLR
ncbi:HlyD family secretion protein [Mesoterricola silvestris]|uniref:Secretion protein n=1 Tax=Mesoterricola silvestris TaxID=2927979 RepID=A0AA48GP08_9BACT|nr:HlyD family efflux transporter periplasmic adaptor subunit [Mesoterricola silvestris]BDU74937.1 secretion protein [Mesoterricola silvestris]